MVYWALLKNNTSRDDNEIIKIKAKNEKEAKEKLKFNKTRFTLVGIYPPPGKGKSYAW